MSQPFDIVGGGIRTLPPRGDLRRCPACIQAIADRTGKSADQVKARLEQSSEGGKFAVVWISFSRFWEAA